MVLCVGGNKTVVSREHGDVIVGVILFAGNSTDCHSILAASIVNQKLWERTTARGDGECSATRCDISQIISVM